MTERQTIVNNKTEIDKEKMASPAGFEPALPP